MLHTQLDNAREIDAVMPTYNFIEYSDSYSKISGSLGIWTSDEPVLYKVMILILMITILLNCLNLKEK